MTSRERLHEGIGVLANLHQEPYWNGVANEEWSLFYFRIRYCGAPTGANIQASDLHLSASGAGVFADIARWTTGDPLSDIDGEPRAGADGVMEHAGADVP